MQKYYDSVLNNGYKFDIRMYVLITSVDPLILYVHEKGKARHATKRYLKPKYKTVIDKHMYLTNTMINV